MPGLQPMKKTRDWCFTINNYNATDILLLEQLGATCKYLIYGQEIADTGTPHLQGFLQFNYPTTFNRIKCLLNNKAHVEPRMGTVNQAIELLQKRRTIHRIWKIS